MSIVLGQEHSLTDTLRPIDYVTGLRLPDRVLLLWHELRSSISEPVEWIAGAVLGLNGQPIPIGRVTEGADPVLFTSGDGLFLLTQIRKHEKVHTATVSSVDLSTDIVPQCTFRSRATWEVGCLSSCMVPLRMDGATAFAYSESSSNGKVRIQLAKWDEGSDDITTKTVCEFDHLGDWCILDVAERKIALLCIAEKLCLLELDSSGAPMGSSPRAINAVLDANAPHLDSYPLWSGSDGPSVGRFDAVCGEPGNIVVLAEISAHGVDQVVASLTVSCDGSDVSPWQPVADSALMPKLARVGAQILIGYTKMWPRSHAEFNELYARITALRETQYDRAIGAFPWVWVGELGADGTSLGEPQLVHEGLGDSWNTEFAVAGSDGYVIWRSGGSQESCRVMARALSVAP